MENSTGAPRRVRVTDSGRLLTPDEAAFLEKYLLGEKPLVVVGNEHRKRTGGHNPDDGFCAKKGA